MEGHAGARPEAEGLTAAGRVGYRRWGVRRHAPGGRGADNGRRRACQGLHVAAGAQVGERAGVRLVVEGLTAAGGRMRVPAANLLNLLLAYPEAAPRALAHLQARAACSPAAQAPVVGRDVRRKKLARAELSRYFHVVKAAGRRRPQSAATNAGLLLECARA